MAKIKAKSLTAANMPVGKPSLVPEAAKGATDDLKRDKVQTVKLFEHEHDRLRKFSYESKTSHQDIIITALLEYLTKSGY